jgi:KRAB domain-containing zinc finger protein
LDTLSGERRSLVRTDKRIKGQHSASVVVGSVRIKAEFDDFSYGDTCSVSPKVLAERKKYRSDGNSDSLGTHVKEEPAETGVFFGDVEQNDADLHTPVASSAYQLAQLTAPENIGSFGMWSHKKFGIGGYVQYGSGGTRSSSQSDSPGLPKSFYPRDPSGTIRGGASIDGSPDSGNSTESRKSFPYGSPKMVVKSEKSPSPKCDPVTTKSTPVQSPLTPEQLLSQSWLNMNRSKSCSPDDRSPAEVLPQSYSSRGESSSGLNSRHSQDFELTSIYPCKFCHEAFSLYTALQEHIRIEHSDDPVNSKSLDYGKPHNKAIPHQDVRSGSCYSDGDGKYTCKFCSLGFEYYTVLQEHIRIAHDGGRRSSVNSNTSTKVPCSMSPVLADGPSKYPCKHCDDSFPLYTALQEHIRIEHGENAYWGRAAYMSMMIDGREEFFEEIMNRCDCQFCPEKFASSLLLQEHVRVEHVPKWAAQKKSASQTLPPTSSNNDPPSVLPVQNSPSEEPLNPDVVKNLLKKYVCAICGKEYANKIRYQVHIKSHNKERTVEKVEPKAEPLPKPAEPQGPLPQFPTNQDTKSVNVEDLRYVCEVCNARFPLYVVMQEHIRTAHGEKPFKCDLCEKEFIKRNYLMKHMKAHAEVKAQVLKCHKCDRCFMDQARLQEHAKEHTNEGRYKCHVCGSCFTHKMHHDQHVRTHSGEKPYKCGECGKQFSQPGPFHNHLRSHARCAYCSRTFLEKAALLLHLKAEHGQKVSEDTNRVSPVSVGSVAGNPVGVLSSLMPVSLRLPENDYIVPSPNEPLNLSKNSKESPLRVTPVTIPTGSHLMSPVMFPGMELYTDLMSSLSAGPSMSVASSNSNNSLNDSTSRPNSAKSDTISEIRLSKSDIRDSRKSPSLMKEREVTKFMKENSKMPSHVVEQTIDGARDRSDVNGSDKIHHGLLSVDFLSTSSGFSSPNSKSLETKQAILSKSSFTPNASLKCDGIESHSTKYRESVEKYWSKSPQLENMFAKTLPPEHVMYSAMMYPELFRNSLSPLSDTVGNRPSSAGMKRRRSKDNARMQLDDLRGSPPSSKITKFENQDNLDLNVDSSSDENLMIATNGNKNFVGGNGDKVVKNNGMVKTDEGNVGENLNHTIDFDDCFLFICGLCMEIFPTESAVDAHVCEGKCSNVKTLSSQDGFDSVRECASGSCDVESFDTSQKMLATKTQIYRCKSCSKIFWEKSLLIEHLETHGEFININTNRGQHFSCDSCDKSFSSSDELIRHLHQHNGIQQHECPICSRMFIIKRHLLTHMSTHSSKCTHSCHECGEKFSLRTSPVQHTNLHNDKGCICNSCGKCFFTVEQLQQHVKIHESESDKVVSVSENVQQNHAEWTQKPGKVHTERPFQCAKCHERFGATTVLVEHVENNMCKSSTCAICQKAFMKKSQLKCHLKTHQRLGEGGKDTGILEDGNRKHYRDARCVSENDTSENMSFTDNCDTSDNLEQIPELATSMMVNRCTFSLKDGVGVAAADGQFHAKREPVASE